MKEKHLGGYYAKDDRSNKDSLKLNHNLCIKVANILGIDDFILEF